MAEDLQADGHNRMGSMDSSASSVDLSNRSPPPPMPPLPSRPFPPAALSPRTQARASAYQVQSIPIEDDEDEYHDDPPEDIARTLVRMDSSHAADAAVAASFDAHGDFHVLSPAASPAHSAHTALESPPRRKRTVVDSQLSQEEGGGSDDDEAAESSMIMHSENPAGHRHSFSHSALDGFASPPPVALPPSLPGPTLTIDAASPQHAPPGLARAVSSPTSGRLYPLPPGPAPMSCPPAASAAAAAPSSSPSMPSSKPRGHARQSSSPGHMEDTALVDYYLRQALQAKDLVALADLVARATEKGVSSELVTQARQLLADARQEARQNEIQTLQHYMRAAIQAKQKEACLDVLRKVEPLATSLAFGPQRRLYADFFTLIAECQATVEELDREDAQTVSVYLKQGIQLRSREVLQAALTKATGVRHALLDQAVLAQAKQLLGELDSQVMLRGFLQLAIKNRELSALDESIAQASKLHLSERDAPELADARRLADDLRAHGQSGGAGLSKEARDRERADKVARKAEKAAREADKEARHAAEKAEKERARAEKEARHSAEKQQRREAESKHEAEKSAGASGEHGKIKEKLKWFGSGSKDKKKASGPLLFGGPLVDAMRRNPASGIPRVVESCVTFLRAKAMSEPGLFRVAGNKEQIDVLRAQLEEAYQADFAAHGERPSSAPALTDVHDTSGLLKLYFRLLPEPLLPHDFYDRFIKLGLNKGAERVGMVKELVRQLPKDNLTVLSYLFAFLSDVSANSGVNQMTPHNLAICHAPNLLRARVETQQSMMNDAQPAISVVETMIANYAEIFGAQQQAPAPNGAGAARLGSAAAAGPSASAGAHAP